MSETWRVAPVLIVSDVTTSMTYCRDQLGFEIAGTFADPIQMAFVRRAGVELMLQHANGKPRPEPNHRYKRETWDVLFFVEDAEALHADLMRRGARIRRAPHDTDYGTREVEALDPDSHVFAFCQNL